MKAIEYFALYCWGSHCQNSDIDDTYSTCINVCIHNLLPRVTRTAHDTIDVAIDLQYKQYAKRTISMPRGRIQNVANGGKAVSK